MRNLTLLLLLASLLGCGNNQASDYKPHETAAREALTRGLTVWKEGGTAGELPALESGEPVVQFVDYQWTTGKRLKNFTLLDETPTLQDSTLKFRVRLEVEGSQPTDTEYYINGIDPLWILRDKDYHQSSMQ
jgi:hypothetical protein